MCLVLSALPVGFSHRFADILHQRGRSGRSPARALGKISQSTQPSQWPNHPLSTNPLASTMDHRLAHCQTWLQLSAVGVSEVLGAWQSARHSRSAARKTKPPRLIKTWHMRFSNLLGICLRAGTGTRVTGLLGKYTHMFVFVSSSHVLAEHWLGCNHATRCRALGRHR